MSSSILLCVVSQHICETPNFYIVTEDRELPVQSIAILLGLLLSTPVFWAEQNSSAFFIRILLKIQWEGEKEYRSWFFFYWICYDNKQNLLN